MFIGICGSICAGKRTIARYLVEHHGFTQVHLERHPRNDSNDGTVDGIAFSADHPGSNKARHRRQHTFFSNPDELLDFVTKHWRERWVTTDIPDETVLDMYARRPFFLLISVDAPVTVRWRRFQARQAASSSTPTTSEHSQQPPTTASPPSSSSCDPSDATPVASPSTTTTTTTTPASSTTTAAAITTLETFVALSDAHLYSPSSGANPLMSRATVRLLNTSSSLAHLYATLGKLDLANPDRLRPSWDSYFMSLASLAARRSNCMKRRVGCVVVRDRRVISTGYNGTPRGLRNCGEGGCGRCNAGEARSGQGLGTCLCLHAEENALLEAGRERLREGAVLYCDTCPCLTCSIKIAQVGVSEVVYSQGYSMDGETAAVFREAGVRLRQFVPPANGLIHLEKPEPHTQNLELC